MRQAGREAERGRGRDRGRGGGRKQARERTRRQQRERGRGWETGTSKRGRARATDVLGGGGDDWRMALPGGIAQGSLLLMLQKFGHPRITRLWLSSSSLVQSSNSLCNFSHERPDKRNARSSSEGGQAALNVASIASSCATVAACSAAAACSASVLPCECDCNLVLQRSSTSQAKLLLLRCQQQPCWRPPTHPSKPDASAPQNGLQLQPWSERRSATQHLSWSALA